MVKFRLLLGWKAEADADLLALEVLSEDFGGREGPQDAEGQMGALGGDPDAAFDYIYVAPPQFHEPWSQALQLLDKRVNWLA